MQLVVEIGPLTLHLVIRLHLDMRLTPFDAILLIGWNEIVEKQGVGALGSIFGQDAHQQQVDNVGLVELQSTNDMPPTEGEQSTIMAFLKRLGQ